MDSFVNAPWEYDFKTHPPPENAELEGVMVETRALPELEGILKNFSCMLPYAAITIFYSKDNIDFLMKIVGPNTNIRFIEFPIIPFVREKYNYYMKSYDFYSNFTSKRMLTFMSDTGIRKNDILRYLKYDYIGAPWIHNPTGDPRVYVGNGALSLRNTSMCQMISKEITNTPPDLNEDVFIAKYIVDIPNVCLPSFDKAVSFSTERIPHPDPMGFHNSDYYFRKYPDEIYRGMHEKVYTCYEGPSRKLFNLISAIIDDSIDISNTVILGIGPNGLRIGKGAKLYNFGSKLKINGLLYSLKNGCVEEDILLKPVQ
jgi:hypothetical protein